MRYSAALISLQIVISAGFTNLAFAQISEKHSASDKGEANPTLILSNPLIYENLKQRQAGCVACLTNVIPDTVSKLYCFHGIVKVLKPQKIKHVWYHQDKVVAIVPLKIRKTSIRGWSWIEMPADCVGKWHVDIVSGSGDKLNAVYFEVTDKWNKLPKLVVLELPDIAVRTNP
ncbi:MAG: DUF2914 domain-containing protein [bacterium]